MKKPALTITWKIILAYTAVFGVLTIALSLLVMRQTREARISRLDVTLATYAGQLSSELEEDTRENANEGVADLAKLVKAGPANIHVRLFDSQRAILLDDSLLNRETDDLLNSLPD